MEKLNIKNLSKLNYNELLLLADTDFYSVVTNPLDVMYYLQCLHCEYCKGKGVQPISLETMEMPNNEHAFFDYNKKLKNSKIYINENLTNVVYELAKENNEFYPHFLVYICVHESKHYIQACNIPKINTGKLSEGENLSVANFKQKLLLHSKSKPEIEKQLKKIKKGTYTAFDTMKDMKHVFNALNNKVEYANSPCEIDANNEGINVLIKIYEQTKSLDVLSSIISLEKSFKDEYKQGLWFLDNQLLKAKAGSIEVDKHVLKAYEHSYKDYKEKRRQTIVTSKGKIDLDVEDHLLNYYPTLNNGTKAIGKLNNIEDFLKSSIKFANVLENFAKPQLPNPIIEAGGKK